MKISASARNRMARWPTLSRQFDCFGKVAVTVALPLAVFELISITASLGDFSAC